MSKYTTTFVETSPYQQSTWHGVSVRVVITPNNSVSSTSQIVIDERQLEELKYLKQFPFDLDYKSPAWQEWLHRREMAMQLVQQISHKIAYDLCKHLADNQ